MLNRKILNISGTVLYVILAVLAVFFYKERTIFVDIAYHVFELITTGSYAIQNNRFGSIFTQSVPLAAIKSGLSLKAVLISYSLAFVAYYACIFFLINNWLKQYREALVLLLFNIVMVTHTFYWVQSEFQQGLAFTILYFAVINKFLPERNKWRFHITIISLVMIVFITFFHPLLIFVFLFYWGFLCINNWKSIAWRRMLVQLTAFFLVLGVKIVFFSTEYDSVALEGLKNFQSLFPDYFTIPSNKLFLKLLIRDYYLLLIFGTAILTYYIARKEYLQLVFTAVFFTGYLFLINISYPIGAATFYIENLYLPLSLFLAIPFVYHIAPAISRKKAIPLLALLVVIRLTDIGLTGNQYTARLEWERDFMEQTADLENKKILVDQADVPIDTLIMTWGTSYEFWLLSTIETGETRSIIIDESPVQFSWAMPGHRAFIPKWGRYDYEVLPEQYFQLSDTTAYQFHKPK